jgi:hypothetical protein
MFLALPAGGFAEPEDPNVENAQADNHLENYGQCFHRSVALPRGVGLPFPV